MRLFLHEYKNIWLLLKFSRMNCIDKCIASTGTTFPTFSSLIPKIDVQFCRSVMRSRLAGSSDVKCTS